MPFRKRSSRRLAAIPLLIVSSCLAVASAGSSAAHECADRSAISTTGPSKLDYLVLASIADSPHLLTMASYHPQE